MDEAARARQAPGIFAHAGAAPAAWGAAGEERRTPGDREAPAGERPERAAEAYRKTEGGNPPGAGRGGALAARLEAISGVVPDAPQPTRGVLEAVHDRLMAGLDADRTMKAVATRVRIPEFTLFCAVLRLQRRAGGKVSDALGNLSGTLRERRKTALKAHSSTAQTRLTLLVLVLLPIAVLVMQKFTSPGSIDILLDTPSGLTVLRVGVGLIAFGLAIAYLLGSRATR